MSGLPNLFFLFMSEMRVPITKISIPVSSMGDFPDLGLRTFFYGKDAEFHDLLPEISCLETGPVQIYMMQDRYHCRYLLRPIESSPGQCWLVGPYLAMEPSRQDLVELSKKMGGSKEGSEFLHLYYKMLPKLLDKNMTETLFRTQAALRYPIRGFAVISWDMGDEAPPISVPVCAETVTGQQEHLEQMYAIESRMMECVSHGNYQGAVTLVSQLRQNGFEARTDSILRNGKDFLLVLNVLCRVAGYSGGVPPKTLDQLSRSFTLKIEGVTRMSQLYSLRDSILQKYCEASREGKDPRYSPVIQKAVDSIEGSFHTALNLNGLAQQFHVSPSYLSTLFRRETGQTFTEYLVKTRLAFAKRLLRETNLPINAIAAECGIVDNNYFARIFKAQEGMTPAQYRADNK